MSYEEKIRELMSRLVGMTPEPPPYPEETQAVPRPQRKSPRPVLAFAAAAALVALVAVPLLLFNGEGGQVLTSSTTTTPMTSTTQAPATTTIPEQTTSTEQALEAAWDGVVFLYQTPVGSFTGNPALVPIAIEIVGPSSTLAPEDQFTAALSAIQADLPDPFSSSIPPDVSVLGVEVDGNTITVDMNEAFLAGAEPPGLLSDQTMLNQMIYTLTYQQPQASVRFTVNGEPVTAFGSEGLDLGEPVTRESFQEQLALIYVTQPLVEAGGRYTVAGIANTFEASLILRVIDSAGETIHEEPVQATCGSGCWGEFLVDLDADLVTPGDSSIQLLTYSARDGSETDVVTIPIPPSLIWQFRTG